MFAIAMGRSFFNARIWRPSNLVLKGDCGSEERGLGNNVRSYVSVGLSASRFTPGELGHATSLVISQCFQPPSNWVACGAVEMGVLCTDRSEADVIAIR